MHDDEGSRAGGDGPLQGCEVDVPAVIEEEREGAEPNVGEVGEVVEEGIGGMGDEDLIAGVAEQTKEVGVGLAGAGGQKELVGRDAGAVPGIVVGDGFSGGGCAAGVGVVAQGGGAGKAGKVEVGAELEAGGGGVGDGEVEEGVAGDESDVGWGAVPGSAAGEVGGHEVHGSGRG